jgi:SprT protein
MRLPDIAQRFYKSAQLLFQFDDVDLDGGLAGSSRCDDRGRRDAPTLPELTSPSGRPNHLRRRDVDLESQTRELLRQLGANKLAREIRVEWNPRMRTAAGRADFLEKLISLNPMLFNLESVNGHSGSEIDRTLRHELAHLLAQWRVRRRRTPPHGVEWRQACRDLGVADEARCHNLPFATKTHAARYVYLCPNCKEKFPRVRKIRRAIACLACCRKHNRGEFDARFRLKRVR